MFYKVKLNKLTRPYSFYPLAVINQIIGIDGIARLIHDKLPNIPVDVARDAISEMVFVIKDELENGNWVNFTKFLSLRTKMSGKMRSSTDYQYDVKVVAIVAKDFQTKTRNKVVLTRDPYEESLPVIFNVKDTASGVNNFLQYGYGVEIYGENIKITSSDKENISITYPSGNEIVQNNILMNSQKKLLVVVNTDPLEGTGPGGKNSVEIRKFSVKNVVYPGKIRMTNEVDGSANNIFLIESQSGGVATITSQTAPSGYEITLIAKLVSNKIIFSVIDNGMIHNAGGTSSSGEYLISWGDYQLKMNIIDYNVLVQNIIKYSRYFMEVIKLSIPQIQFALEAEIIGDFVVTGGIFGEANTNRQFLEVEGNRFVWVGSIRPAGDFPRAQTLVGSVSEDGEITYGTLTEDTLGTNALSLNTHGVCQIGNNKFARLLTTNSPTNLLGYGVWDCGSSGLSATLLTTNENGVITYPTGGWRDSVLHSNGKMYLVGDPYSPDYDKCRIRVCDISNITGVISNPVDIDAVFGANRTVYYYSGDQGEMQGRAIPGDGAMWVVKTADIDESSNPKMEVIISNGLSVNSYQCADSDGDPLALSIADDGVFAFAYRTTDGKIRVRSGKLTGFVPSFGDLFDIYEGATGQDLFPADMGYFGDGKFLLSVQNSDTNTTDNIVFETDGSSVTCDNTNGSALSVSPAGESPIMIAQSGYAGKLLVGQLRETTKRTTGMLELASDPVILTNAVSVGATVSLGIYKYFAIVANASITSVTVDLTGLTADLDLYIKAGSRPNYTVNDGSSENSGTDSEQIVIGNVGETTWYIGVYGYQAGGGTLTVTMI